MILWDVIMCEGLPVILRIAVSILQAQWCRLLRLRYGDREQLTKFHVLTCFNMFSASLLRQKWVSVITRVEIQHFTFWQLSCWKVKEEMVWHTGSVLVWNVLLAEECLKMLRKNFVSQDFVLWLVLFLWTSRHLWAWLPGCFTKGLYPNRFGKRGASLVESILIPNPLVPSAIKHRQQRTRTP